MNEILIQNIHNFTDSIINYLKLEYDPVYHEKLIQNIDDFFDFIGPYYMGGSTVPETARYVVELILMRSKND